MKSYINAVKFMFNKMPSHVIFFVTARCNARCKHCFYWKSISVADKSDELSLEEIDKISKSMEHIKILSLTGGEPFIRQDLAAIAEIFYKNNEVHHLFVHSNGLFPDRIKCFAEDVLERCPNMSLAISLSLDDFEEDHDVIRGVNGSFKKVLETIKVLQPLRNRYSNFEVDITSAVSQFNFDHMTKLMDYVSTSLDVDSQHIELVRGHTRDTEAKLVTAGQFRGAVNYLRNSWTKKSRKDHYRFASLKRVVDVLTPEIEMETMEGNRMILPCVAGKRIIVISEKGEVTPCELLDKSFGNVRDVGYDMKKLLFSGKAIEIKKWIRESKCFCTWGCATSNNIVFNLAAYPRVFRKWLELKRGNSGDIHDTSPDIRI